MYKSFEIVKYCEENLILGPLVHMIEMSFCLYKISKKTKAINYVLIRYETTNKINKTKPSC